MEKYSSLMSANYCRHISHRSLFRGSSVTTLMNWLTSRKVLLSGAAAGLYTYDSIAGVGKINRGLRTVKTALWTLYDYKFCVDHEPIDTVHDRVAKRW